MRRKRMPERMAGRMLINTNLFDRYFNGALDATLIRMMSFYCVAIRALRPL